MKYIKKFETHSDYENYLESQDYLTPNVSYCVDQNEVHFEKYTPQPIETRVAAKFNNTTEALTQIVGYIETGKETYDATVLFDNIEINGVEIDLTTDLSDGKIMLSSGEHTIKYTLIDNTDVGYRAFDSCTNLTSIVIPSSVTSIGNYVFQNCTGLTAINIPTSVTTIGEYAFSSCTGLTSITIPNSVTTIEDSAFYGCSGLTSITIPESVTTIEMGTFYGCTGLTSVTIPSSVTTIGNGAFQNCTGLTTIDIPSSVTTIETSAFQNCTSLTSITCRALTPPTLGQFPPFSNTNNCPIYVPAASVDTYKAASGWSTYASRIQAIPAE